MNKIMLKQQQQEKEKSEGKSKKKEKKKEKQEQIRITLPLIETRLFEHFQNHIGEENSTTSEELFQETIGVNSSAVNSYARVYWFEAIKKMIRKLRRENRCFILKKSGRYFVLQSEEECEYYQGLCDRAITHMEKAKVRADDWVENESWKSMPSINQRVLKAKEKKDETPEEKADSFLEKAKTKIIKVYKGEENEN